MTQTPKYNSQDSAVEQKWLNLNLIMDNHCLKGTSIEKQHKLVLQ